MTKFWATLSCPASTGHLLYRLLRFPQILRKFCSKFFELCCRSLVECGLERDRRFAECHVLERVKNLVHFLCGHWCPSAVFDNADFAVAVVFRLEVREELFCCGEESCVKRCCAYGEMAVTECLCDRLRRVRACQIHNRYISAFFAERFGEPLRGFCRVAVNACVGDEHALCFRCVAAPGVVLVNVEV